MSIESVSVFSEFGKRVVKFTCEDLNRLKRHVDNHNANFINHQDHKVTVAFIDITEETTAVADKAISTLHALEKEGDEMDNFIDFLVDKMDGDRVKLLDEYRRGEDEW